jgi:phospholipid/cholesterol/gamma-HCH transport system ATP-binding protein
MSATAKALAYSTPAIEFRNVSLSFAGIPALTNVSFKLRRGEIILLTGASASGKSVLLRLAIGLLRPDKGKILIKGREIESLAEDELLAIRGGSMGMVFQEDALFSGMTVYDNTAFRPTEHGWPNEVTDRSVIEVLRFVGLEKDVEKLPEELSGGMRRRLELARAIVGWPSIMLYDEPTSSLDPLSGEQILDLVIRARDIHNISSIYVTKELHEIPYLSTHYAVELKSGEVVVREAGLGEKEPVTSVIVLDKGNIAFRGNYREFAASNSPSVEYLTRGGRPATRVSLYVPDPWSKRNRPQSGLGPA